MIVAGIDPGKSGALFVFDGAHYQAAREVPLYSLKVGKSKKTVADYVQWSRDWGELLLGVDHVFIEAVHAMPKQGATSMFTFGYAAGFAHGLIVGQNLPHTFITPQKWKKIVGLAGSDGEESRRRASQLHPRGSDLWSKKGQHGVAEAALIAYAGKQILEGKA